MWRYTRGPALSGPTAEELSGPRRQISSWYSKVCNTIVVNKYSGKLAYLSHRNIHLFLRPDSVARVLVW